MRRQLFTIFEEDGHHSKGTGLRHQSTIRVYVGKCAAKSDGAHLQYAKDQGKNAWSATKAECVLTWEGKVRPRSIGSSDSGMFNEYMKSMCNCDSD
jgi:hypothetical protein